MGLLGGKMSRRRGGEAVFTLCKFSFVRFYFGHLQPGWIYHVTNAVLFVVDLH